MSAPLEDAPPRRSLALVTGGCSGIGRAIAGELAARGHDLVLVSERAGPLDEAAATLRRERGMDVRALCIDLARPGAAEEVHGRLREAGLAVDVLVNNAGFFFFGEAVDAPPDRANALLQLHVVTPSLLCTRIGREMRERRRGRILVVSSISAWRDFPGIAYYGASKRYLRGFARSLRSEMKPYGVTVTCLSPGPVATGLYGHDSPQVRRGRQLGLFLEPEQVARAGVRALLRGDAECVPGASAWLMAWASALTPQWVVDLVRRRAPWLGR
ncbi:MAG TPA: SDR family NAD(P)-dependent oxidoreductase [Anaeromyxobacteraceae bacterium]|nr:SDR family NAD(P)-dependent oxidoreductase [Anaeromyxobacteraceae bacterium]